MTVTAELEQPLQILLARQPIFTKNRDVAAYELLFRDDTGEFVAGLKDPELTFKILRLVNSASLNLNREVSSLSHAIALLGMEQVKRWVMLFLSSSDGEKPMNYFFVGLLSQLDALLGIPLPELIQQVPLEQELKLALTERQGEQGQLLDDVCLFEQGKFERISAALPKQFFDVAYRHSIEWANQIVKVLV